MESVGKLLRNRYVDTMRFLPSEYDAANNNLHYHSTNLARTIQSADCVLHGLYPHNESLIPLHIDFGITYLSPTRMMFYYSTQLREQTSKNKQIVMKQIDTRMGDLTAMVREYYGGSEWKYGNEAIAFDGMCCRLAHGIDDKPDAFAQNELNEFGKYMVQMLCGQMSYDKSSLRMIWGNVLFKMLELMKASDVGNGNGNMHLISCHDDSLLAMLCAIYGESICDAGLEWPPYASHIIFELWRGNGGKYVKVLYNGQALKVFDGKEVIALEKLEERWKDLLLNGNEHMDLV